MLLNQQENRQESIVINLLKSTVYRNLRAGGVLAFRLGGVSPEDT